MASLVGRILRAVTLIAAFLTLAATASAAPFAAIVMDARSGATLWEQNADARLHPASLTKMMTLYIAFQEIQAGRLSLDTMVTVSAHAAAQPPSRLGLKPGQKIAMRYLIRAAAIKSANDAAMAIGEHIGGGSEAAFARRMTKTARALGMKNTTFRNPNGLTAEGHLSSARDMTILGRHLFYDFPQYYGIFSRRSADAGMAEVRNTNARFLDAYEGADGIKTGYTVAAGFNLTASARRGDVRIIATIFGSGSTAQRNARMAELMDMGFALARKGGRTVAPEPAPLPEAEPLLSDAAPPVAAARTIRVSGEVRRSLRPRPRPGTDGGAGIALAANETADGAAPAVVPDAVSLAIAEGVNSVLAEATAPPPPEGTLEAQAVALAPVAASAGKSAVESGAGAAAEGAPGAPAAAMLALAGAEPAPEATQTPSAAPAPLPAAGTLESQAAVLIAGAAAPEAAAPETVETPPAALPRPQPRPPGLRPSPAAGPAAGPATEDEATARPVMTAEAAPRSGQGTGQGSWPDLAAPDAGTVALAAAAMPAAKPEQTPVAGAAEAVAPAPTDPGSRTSPILLASDEASGNLPPDTQDATVALTAIEAVSAPASPPAPVRAAPIFDRVARADAEAPQEGLVVVSKSTSGGAQWSVNVGAFRSRGEAERALMKTGIAESATLEGGARRITEKGGKYRATFLGLTEDQAGLACRRIRARGQACEASGPAA